MLKYLIYMTGNIILFYRYFFFIIIIFFQKITWYKSSLAE